MTVALIAGYEQSFVLMAATALAVSMRRVWQSGQSVYSHTDSVSRLTSSSCWPRVALV